MNDLVDLIIAACTKATAGELFDDAAAESGQTTVTVYDSFLQKNEPGQAPKKEHPFILVRPVGGEETVEKSEIFVPMQCGIHTHGNVDAGVHDIRRIVGLLLQGLSDNSQFPSYYLTKIIVTLGAPQDGAQAHPKYYAHMELTFGRAPILNNY
ncbi:MAG: hypothetical protein KKC77_18425 [Proteobacteria bacterium]|nr:hypothetical protein [Pseudomonadota bacterium]